MNTSLKLPRRVPDSQGVSSAAILGFVDAIEDAGIEMHSFMLLRHGNVVAEGWWKPYRPENRHVMFSVSKSFTSTAVGFAINDGLITLDDAVVSFFPEDLPAKVSENLSKMRIRHLLMMGTGHAEESISNVVKAESPNWVRGFLSRPVEFEPGTQFVYNSGASYMVASILRKVTGLNLTEYLTPRLFDPLGFVDPWWEKCPMGTDTGGWGLNIRTEELARFTQLYLQRGRWDGKPLLPSEWVDIATSRHISNGDKPESDWAQGYGFQFWRCRHNAYRGDGALGQFCLVMPDQDAVFVSTGGYQDMQQVLNLVWNHVLPGMEPTTVPQDSPYGKRLPDRCAGLQLTPVTGESQSVIAESVSGKTYQLEANDDNWKSVTTSIDASMVTLEIIDGDGRHVLVIDGADWRDTNTDIAAGTVPSPKDGRTGGMYPCAVSGAWTDPRRYTLKICGAESPFTSTFVLSFEEDGRLTIDRSTNVAFGPTERPRIVGHAANS